MSGWFSWWYGGTEQQQKETEPTTDDAVGVASKEPTPLFLGIDAAVLRAARARLRPARGSSGTVPTLAQVLRAKAGLRKAETRPPRRTFAPRLNAVLDELHRTRPTVL